MGPGGAERAMWHLLGHLAGRHAVTLLTFERPDAVPFYSIPDRVQCVRIDRLGGNRLQRPFRILSRPSLLRRAVKDLAPDVIVSFMDTTNITTLVSCIGLAVPVVISERIDPSMHRIGELKNAARRYTYPLARFVVTPTKRVADYFPSSLQPKIRIIGNPIASPAVKAKPSESVDRKRIIAVGRCEPQKGFDRLIDAFSVVAEDHPDWDLVIIGDGPDRLQLEAQGRKLGLGARICFRGVTSDVFSDLAAAHLMAFPSRYEGFPNALAEGLAVGLPAVGYRGVSGVEELIVHGETGLLIGEDAGTSEFAGALSALMADPDLRARFGAAAQRHVGKWASDGIFARWDALLSEATR
jgi:GalNAc-alpha-(1->4)-GalNAc-alpha-(1->3)-diNAcBac-PP-undecaprenol alpha-1,4-N-acetyl-D-galactosaminyltransferase